MSWIVAERPTASVQAISCRWRLALVCGLSVWFEFGAVGCKRSFYKRTADQDAYSLVAEQGRGPSYAIEPGFTVEPDPRSRFYDPTCNVDPMLPIPAPQLYNYQFPSLVTPEPPARNLQSESEGLLTPPPISPEPASPTIPGEQEQMDVPEPEDVAPRPLVPSELESSTLSKSPSATSIVRASLASATSNPATGTVPAPVLASARLRLTDGQDDPTVTAALPLDESGEIADSQAEEVPAPIAQLGQDNMLPIPPVPAEAWQSLPDSCLKRMLEFDTVRLEYERTFQEPVTESLLDSARRVNLENILEIALINSREYQTRREALYRVALRLSLQRFEFDLRFTPRGNGTSALYTHDRVAGTEVNRLAVPTGVGITKSLYTGGELIARFANDVVLTFNGPSGYSSSVGSEIFIDLFQPILQRDVRFEPLTQAERDVVYAARDYIRFRRVLFRDLAAQYYALLLTYRGIAIDTQDYFSNLREFNRASATEQAGQIPMFQVDQFEQNVLRSRGNLINSCNALEGSLDRLKIRIGLPTEFPLNLALSELEVLTLRDEASVLLQQLDRKTRVFLRSRELGGVASAISPLTEVARRMLSLAEVYAKLGESGEGEGISEVEELQVLVAVLEAEEKRLQAREKDEVLERNARATGDEAQLLPAALYLRIKEVIELTLEANRQELFILELMREAEADITGESDAVGDETANPGDRSRRLERNLRGENSASENESVDQRQLSALLAAWETQVQDFVQLDSRLDGIPYAKRTELLAKLNEDALRQLQAAKRAERQILDALAEVGIILASSEEDLSELVELVLGRQSAGRDGTGLAALEVDVDEAMLTALVQRLDLMNTRGELADAWREIKYAGDDLRSILNLRATQSIRTRTGGNNPFDFTFDDSTTRLGMDFDTPLNRRVERNVFRLALINYNVALRQLIESQDTIKLSIRDDLRAIELDRNQYDIAVASAALAYERVTSTRLQVALAQGNVSARDFLEAQQAYTQSLSAVAQQHIDYIVDRIQFFVDVEQLRVDEVNFWPELRNDEYPFQPNLYFPGTNPRPYGSLPRGPWYSKCIRRMEAVPPGNARIFRTPEANRDPSADDSGTKQTPEMSR